MLSYEVKFMDCSRIGKLILKLRKEKGMTQMQLADVMNISDKTISKWERGFGCPDISLLGKLGEILDVNIEELLKGDLKDNIDTGNIKKINFYVCPNCNNTIISTTKLALSCCGRKLVPAVARTTDSQHKLQIEEIEDDYYATFSHEMNKDHYISFVAYVTYDRVLLIKLYPQQGAQVRLPKMYDGKFYFYCSRHGLWVNK